MNLKIDRLQSMKPCIQSVNPISVRGFPTLKFTTSAAPSLPPEDWKTYEGGRRKLHSRSRSGEAASAGAGLAECSGVCPPKATPVGAAVESEPEQERLRQELELMRRELEQQQQVMWEQQRKRDHDEVMEYGRQTFNRYTSSLGASDGLDEEEKPLYYVRQELQ